MSSLSSLEGLSEIGLRGAADMRPTLLRVLTDLYVQKLTHTPDEERHYTELALRLLDSVDVATRAAVAARLARHLSPPCAVMARLAADLPEVTAAMRQNAPLQSPSAAVLARRTSQDISLARIGELEARRATSAPPMPNAIGSEVAGELNELFFAAGASERSLILRNLHIVVAAPAGHTRLVSDPAIGRRLEAAALARRQEEFVRELARCLCISRRQAQRIANDQLGEPIVVAAKALSIPRDLLYRILLFVNTAVGHSVERVHALAALYDDITVEASLDLVAVWQALPVGKHQSASPSHQPLLANATSPVRPAAAPRRLPMVLQRRLRRDAS